MAKKNDRRANAPAVIVNQTGSEEVWQRQAAPAEM